MKNKTTEQQYNRKIRFVVDIMFEDIPYSAEVNEAQQKIEEALNTEFDKIKGDKQEDAALEELLEKYGRLANMAKLAGYPRKAPKSGVKKARRPVSAPLKRRY